MRKEIRELNKIARVICGKVMTDEQRKTLEELRTKVKQGEFSVEECWKEKYR